MIKTAKIVKHVVFLATIPIIMAVTSPTPATFMFRQANGPMVPVFSAVAPNAVGRIVVRPTKSPANSAAIANIVATMAAVPSTAAKNITTSNHVVSRLAPKKVVSKPSSKKTSTPTIVASNRP